MKVLCFDIGGTNIKYGVIQDGNIIEKSMFPTNYKRGHKDVTDRLIATAKKVQKKHPDIEGVGISCAGSINFDKGCMITPPDAIQEFGEWDFEKLFMEELGLRIVADNDVNSFAACECKMGAGSKYKTYLVMTVGTGIGGAIVMNDEIWRGKNYNAGEVGRILIGNAKWESVASTSALIKDAKRAGLEINNGVELFELYDAKDEIAIAVVNRFYDLLGIGMANLVYMFNPEAIVIGGGISKRESLAPTLEKYMNAHMPYGFRDTAKVVNATFKNDGGMLGAYFNFVEYIKKNGE